MHYVVDGYNVIGQSDQWSRGTLRERRERLLLWIEGQCPQGAGARVTVVFDGREDVSSPRWGGPTRVMYSAGRSADDMVKALVDDASHPRCMVVVTDDRAIQRWVRQAGARVMGSGAFLSAGAKPPRSKDAGDLPAQDAEAITRELRRVWK